MTTELNGWDARKLDSLARDVHDQNRAFVELRRIVDEMQAAQVAELKDRVNKLESRTQRVVFAFGVPVIVAVITAALGHVFG